MDSEKNIMLAALAHVYQTLSLTELLLFCLLTEVVVLAAYFKLTGTSQKVTCNSEVLDNSLLNIQLLLSTINGTLHQTQRKNEKWHDDLYSFLSDHCDCDEEHDKDSCDGEYDEENCDGEHDEDCCDGDDDCNCRYPFMNVYKFILEAIPSLRKETENTLSDGDLSDGDFIVVAFNLENDPPRPFLYRRGAFTTYIRDSVNQAHRVGYATITFKLDEQTDPERLINYHGCADNECRFYDNLIEANTKRGNLNLADEFSRKYGGCGVQHLAPTLSGESTLVEGVQRIDYSAPVLPEVEGDSASVVAETCGNDTEVEGADSAPVLPEVEVDSASVVAETSGNDTEVDVVASAPVLPEVEVDSASVVAETCGNDIEVEGADSAPVLPEVEVDSASVVAETSGNDTEVDVVASAPVLPEVEVDSASVVAETSGNDTEVEGADSAPVKENDAEVEGQETHIVSDSQPTLTRATEVKSSVDVKEKSAIKSVRDVEYKTSWADEIPDDEPVIEKRKNDMRSDSTKTRTREYSRRKEESRRSRR